MSRPFVIFALFWSVYFGIQQLASAVEQSHETPEISPTPCEESWMGWECSVAPVVSGTVEGPEIVSVFEQTLTYVRLLTVSGSQQNVDQNGCSDPEIVTSGVGLTTSTLWNCENGYPPNGIGNSAIYKPLSVGVSSVVYTTKFQCDPCSLDDLVLKKTFKVYDLQLIARDMQANVGERVSYDELKLVSRSDGKNAVQFTCSPMGINDLPASVPLWGGEGKLPKPGELVFDWTGNADTDVSVSGGAVRKQVRIGVYGERLASISIGSESKWIEEIKGKISNYGEYYSKKEKGSISGSINGHHKRVPMYGDGGRLGVQFALDGNISATMSSAKIPELGLLIPTPGGPITVTPELSFSGINASYTIQCRYDESLQQPWQLLSGQLDFSSSVSAGVSAAYGNPNVVALAARAAGLFKVQGSCSVYKEDRSIYSKPEINFGKLQGIFTVTCKVLKTYSIKIYEKKKDFGGLGEWKPQPYEIYTIPNEA